jgi:glyoxalase family protein
MSQPIEGIHHVTAIASDPQRNLDFYTQVLGLRLVKRTVNFDDPGTYHLYFGDETGTPGTILTFFPWPHAARGRVGAGQATETSFAIPVDALDYWEQRLVSAGLPAERAGERFGEQVLRFADPDGLRLELVPHAGLGATDTPWSAAAIPTQHAIRGFYSVTLCEQGYEDIAPVLASLGFRAIGSEGNRFRFEVGQGGASTRIDVLCSSEAPFGSMGAGTVHHIAWRVPDEAAQIAWRDRLVGRRLNVTPVIDRRYFHSIYFREPGGVLFEIATDPPGFAIDESPAVLGEHLQLPPWLEQRRHEIEHVLPRIEIHDPRRVHP